MRGPLDIHRQLLSRGIRHEILHLTRRVTSGEDLPESLGVPAEACAVVHVVIADDEPVALVLPAGRSWSPTALARALGVRSARRADPGETSAATEYSHALVSPLALPDGVTVVLDASLAELPTLFTATGQTATAVMLSGPDLVVAAGARVASVGAPALDDPSPLPALDRFAGVGA